MVAKSTLLRRRCWIPAYWVTLAPRSNRDGVDFFAIWTLHETHNAIPTHQIACLAQGAFFGSEHSAHAFPVQAPIEIVRGPGHAR